MLEIRDKYGRETREPGDKLPVIDDYEFYCNEDFFLRV